MPSCSKCKKEKDQYQMKTNKTCLDCAIKAKNYYHSHKEQQAKTNKIWRSKNKNRLVELSKKWKQNNPEKWKESHKKSYQAHADNPNNRLGRARRRAKKKNIDFSITLEEYTNIINNPCYYCNGCFGKVTRGSGLDRIDNAKGYTNDNVISCCKTCNTLKGENFTAEETLAAVRAILQYRQALSLNQIQS